VASGNGKRNGRSGRLDLGGRAAVVTGGASGIGQATSIELARRGAAAVAVVDLSEHLEPLLAEANRELGRDALVPFRGDATDSDFRERVFGEMERRFGAVSVCVPAAGITRDRLAVKIDRETKRIDLYPEADFRRVLEVDLVAPIYWSMRMIASVAQERARRGVGRWEPAEGVQGCAILIGSVSSTGNRGQVSYASAKAGLEGAQGTLASEAAYYGVRCAIIHPGYTDTRMVAALGEEFISRNILPHTQLGRLISPGEIADAIVFMIQNSAVSGQVWVDAGWHPGA
jgi:3-oxoacyl-[acyl-carrier protein] reductase